MEPPSHRAIHIIDQAEAGASAGRVENAARIASQHYLPPGEVAILLCDDAEIQQLNAKFRGIAEPTDVLTFPSGESTFLGDIAISVPYARRQADVRGVELDVELAYLAIHGILHLAGYDDVEAPERAAMQREMDRCGQLVGLPSDPEWSSVLHAEVVA